MPTNANRDLKNHTYQILKERLINCIYEPGTMLNEAQLATDLGLSRTPVREAISRLEMDGFIKIIPKKGIYVAAPHLPMEELYEFRKKFQGDLTDIQNGYRLDTAMHLFIIEHCGNRYIIDMMHKLFDDNTRVIIASKQNQVQIHDARHEHLEIIETLIDKEYEKAAAMMQTHIESCRRAAVDYFYSLQAFSSTPPPTYKQRLQELEI